MPSNVTTTEWNIRNNDQTVDTLSEYLAVILAGTPTDALAAALAGALVASPSVNITVGAEAANVINVAVQVVDSGGNALEQQLSLLAWLSDTAGAAPTATAPDGDVAIGTDGTIVLEYTTDVVFELLTDAVGALDLDIGESLADTWYLNVRLPGGAVVTSAVITFAGP